MTVRICGTPACADSLHFLPSAMKNILHYNTMQSSSMNDKSTFVIPKIKMHFFIRELKPYHQLYVVHSHLKAKLYVNSWGNKMKKYSNWALHTILRVQAVDATLPETTYVATLQGNRNYCSMIAIVHCNSAWHIIIECTAAGCAHVSLQF